MNISGYQITEKIYESANSKVYQAVREDDQELVMVKSVNDSYPRTQDVAKIRREHQIVAKLNGLEGIIEVYELVPHGQGNLAIIMEPFGLSLAAFMRSGQRLSLSKFFKIALKITKTLGLVHQENVVHKDINPRNILIDPSLGEIRLIDFGIASQLSHERQDVNAARRLEGSLPYISPEQTGRMNRDLDYRTDYYSLGATFYDILTGQLPFQADDLLGWVHCHISQQPIAPHQLDAQIPPILSELILKLMAKNAGERYQSAYGLSLDLERCQKAWEERGATTGLRGATTRLRGAISPFPLGQGDVSERFQVPQELYGREAEVKTLLESFAEVAAGATGIVMVSGYSGVGKSALVHEVQKPIVGAKGYFIEGKFDQFQRNVPYSALAGAFRHLTRQLLTEPAEQVAAWKEALLNVFGPNGQIMLDLVPELVHIVGQQPPVQELAPTESQHRFHFLFLDFVKLFASQSHPLVIFLDDLQWSDGPTLTLLQQIATSDKLSHLLLIGAYRDNEVGEGHPLLLALDTIQKGNAIRELHLKPLSQPAVSALVSDTLHCQPEQARPLAKLLHEKTEGNPFFVGELLKSLYQDGIISFQSEVGRWIWQIEQVRQAEVSRNVVEFMIASLKKLPPLTQEALQLAACIGNLFDLSTLSIIYEHPANDTSQALLPALKANLVVPLDDDYKFVGPTQNHDLNPRYKFQHDRVQQAAYALIDEQQKQAVHLSIGRLMQSHTPLDEQEERLIEMVRQLNKGQALITAPQERSRLADLNLKAGIKAKKAIAYQPALQYLATGIALLGANGWQQQYDLTFGLKTEYAQCLYLTGDSERCQAELNFILDQVKTDFERAQIQAMHLRQYVTSGRTEDGIRAGLEGLKLLGMSIPYQPSKLLVLKEILLAKWHLGRRQTADLLDLPLQTAPEKILIVKLIMEIVASAFLIGNDNLHILATLKVLNLSLREGNSHFSAHAYVTYGLILAGMFGDFKQSYEFGQLAVALSERLQDIESRARVILIYTLSIHHWSSPWQSLTGLLQQGLEAAYQAGDLTFIAYSATYMNHWNPELDLNTLCEAHQKYRPIIKNVGYQDPLDSADLLGQTYLNYRGLTEGQFSLNNPSTGSGHRSTFDESDRLEGMRERNYASGVTSYHILKAEIHYCYEDYGQALHYIRAANETIIPSTFSTPWAVRLSLVSFLAFAAVYPTQQGKAQREAWKRLKKEHKQSKKWADHCPVNFLHLQLIMEAELAKLSGHAQNAITLYQQAIKRAKENAFRRDEALANELAAKFYLSLELEEAAEGYMRQAAYLYYRWGADRKVEQLTQSYPHLLPETERLSRLSQEQSSADTESISVDMLSTRSQAESDTLDLASVMKASQAISSEIALDKLLAKLLNIVLENAGAQRGVLILRHNDRYLIEAEGAVGQDEVEVLQSRALDEQTQLSSAIINYVIRSQEEVILHDASHAAQFSHDPYISQYQPKSVLCMPLINQTELVGLIYLENNLTTHAFTPQRVEIMRLLGTQAAISISHAQAIQLRAQQTQLRLEKELAQKANQAKSDFLSSMSHELRTPLNGILGYAQLLKRDQALQSRQKSAVEIIHQSGHHLLTLINDILDLSKIEARKMDLYPQELHLSSFLNTVEGIIRMRAEEKDVLFVYQPDDTLPTSIKADEKRLRQVLINLLGNAVKFTKRGQVTLNVSRRDNQSNNCRGNALRLPKGGEGGCPLWAGKALPLQVSPQCRGDASRSPSPLLGKRKALPLQVTLRFEVIDTGVGMTPSQLKKIFLPFEQVGEVKQRAKGTGLGLAITRQLVNLMDGEVEVSSELGKGSRFWFDLTLPVVESKKKEEKRINGHITGYQGARRHILVVDDKAQNRLLLRDLLSSLGFAISEAENGQQEVELTRQIKPDLILTDLLMPVMSGFEAVKQIRHFAPDLPIIAISASAFEADQEKSRLAGCNAFLAKPIEEPALLALIGQHLELEWTYEVIKDQDQDQDQDHDQDQHNNEAQEKTTENKPFNAPQLIAPPAEELEQLYELASLGRMSALRKRLAHIEQLDQKYAPFASQVRQLARAFEDDKIVTLVEGYLATNQ